jgi:hypothetical protein
LAALAGVAARQVCRQIPNKATKLKPNGSMTNLPRLEVFLDSLSERVEAHLNTANGQRRLLVAQTAFDVGV